MISFETKIPIIRPCLFIKNIQFFLKKYQSILDEHFGVYV